jgi:excisionase family DNA binding protein
VTNTGVKPKPLTTREAAARLGCKVRWVQTLIARGEIKAVLFSGVLFIDPANLKLPARRPGRPKKEKPNVE